MLRLCYNDRRRRWVGTAARSVSNSGHGAGRARKQGVRADAPALSSERAELGGSPMRRSMVVITSLVALALVGVAACGPPPMGGGKPGGGGGGGSGGTPGAPSGG